MCGQVFGRLIATGDHHKRNVARHRDRGNRGPIPFQQHEVISHAVKALRLAPERLHDRVNIRWQLPHLSNQSFKRSCCGWTKNPDEAPRSARGPSGQERQARADNSDVREQRANSRQLLATPQ